MADISSRPYSKNYSGLISQSVLALCITGVCIAWHEFAKRKRRGGVRTEGLGSVDSWEFGYLYQARSWAKNNSPPLHMGWPLSWIKEVIPFPEDELARLRGIDAALYIRILRACFWFTTLQTFTTFIILFPVHVEFSDDAASPQSMTRASIASLVLSGKGLDLLWIHITLLVYITFSWMAMLYWICQGVFRMRHKQIEEAATRKADSDNTAKHDSHYYPHPHPHPTWPFPPSVEKSAEDGLKLRTVMVSNIGASLRSEPELKEYFEFYMGRKMRLPSMGLPSTTQPGFFNKWFAFLINRARRLSSPHAGETIVEESEDQSNAENSGASKPLIERVVVARKMTELASLLERREEVLRRLETAHIKLAVNVLTAVKNAMDQKDKLSWWKSSKASSLHYFQRASMVEKGESGQNEERMDLLFQTLAPYLLDDSHDCVSKPTKSSHVGSDSESDGATIRVCPPTSRVGLSPRVTIWEALLGLPRNYLDPYQPLVRLNVFFRGKTVPAIDYYTTKLKVLTELITENRSKPITDYEAVSTAFVTFADPRDARRACKYLAVHPNNPLTCLVTMAPSVEDLDWIPVMKSQFKVEFLKDWVINCGVWAFTLFWLFPVSALTGLVSIQNISNFWPGLKNYLDNHPWQGEVIQSFVPTLLVALLALLVPLLLYLIARRVHTFPTLSAIEDVILTRYYKFLIVNVLVFFCIGTAFFQTFFTSLGAHGRQKILNIVATTFPSAGPFYVGWLIFMTAMHAGFELALFGYYILIYITVRREITPRRRAIGIRPPTFNYSYWLPLHLLVIHVLLLFSVLNPLVIPFGLLYFFVQYGVIKNQMIHVYAKNYERNGQVLLIRFVRYSLDGLILSQAVFLVYMVVLEKKANVGVAAVLVIFTTFVKIFLTRLCRVQFEHDDLIESLIACGIETSAFRTSPQVPEGNPNQHKNHLQSRIFGTWRRPEWLSFSYSTVRPHSPQRRHPNPFGPQAPDPQSSRIVSISPGDDMQKMPTLSQTVATTADILAHAGADTRPQHLESIGPVVLHPPPRPWDDQTHVDLPYDNPYYTRSIRDILWLPQDPMSTLNLEDTIDLRQSITCDPNSGELGTWLGQADMTNSPFSISRRSDRSSPIVPRSSSLIRQYTGTEDVELPPGIAQRVRSLRKGEGVEEANGRRPSIWRRVSSFSGMNDASATRDVRRPSFFRTFPAFRSSVQLPQQTGLLSPEDQQTGPQSELGTRPDMHAQADYVRSAFSLADAEVTETEIVRPPHLQVLSTQEVLQLEIQAEEAEALEQRITKEEEEAQAASGRYLWWVPSWMFRAPQSI